MHSRPGCEGRSFGRTIPPDRVAADARVWIVGTILLFFVSFLVSFAAVRWLPDLITSSADNSSKLTARTSTSTSEATPFEQFDNSRGVTPKPVIPIVIRQKTSVNAEVSDLPPQTEISSPLTPVVDTANALSTPQLLDLREIENAKQVQQRLIDLGFLFSGADGIWGQHSRRALQEFRAANGLGESDTWDEATQERLLRAPDAKAANTSGISFIGGWGVDVAECRDSPITITARRAEGFGASCEFHSTQRESSNAWRLRAECASQTERWNANIRLTISTSKLTWSSERGTTTYVRCPVTSASR
jgi:peptidoglycan hydrolase-like protein with peptidoglycan-binding domain